MNGICYRTQMKGCGSTYFVASNSMHYSQSLVHKRSSPTSVKNIGTNTVT